jgi:hypothetical protein
MTDSTKRTDAGVVQDAVPTEYRARTAQDERARADHLYLLAAQQVDPVAADACRAMADACQERAERLDLRAALAGGAEAYEAGRVPIAFRERVPEMNPRQTASERKATSMWRYDEGILTIRYLGKMISLGRYATREHAAKAAAAYFASHEAPGER